jgi:hypothetical protein
MNLETGRKRYVKKIKIQPILTNWAGILTGSGLINTEGNFLLRKIPLHIKKSPGYQQNGDIMDRH